MTTTKLTLSVESTLVREAKSAAAGWQTSVSALFSRLVRAMTMPSSGDLQAGPIVRHATGLVELPQEKKDNELLTEALSSKYGVAE